MHKRKQIHIAMRSILGGPVVFLLEAPVMGGDNLHISFYRKLSMPLIMALESGIVTRLKVSMHHDAKDFMFY